MSPNAPLPSASTSSPLWKLPVIATVADAMVAESESVSVKPASTTTGAEGALSPETKVVVPPLSVTIGDWSVGTTLIVRWKLVLTFVPSVITKLMTRCVPSGVAAESVKRTERSAACHCASVAVPPAELRASTPFEYAPVMLPIVEPSLVNSSVSPFAS